MTRADVINRLKAVEAPLREQGIAALYLYGSYARDEAEPASDLDVFVDPANEDGFGLTPLLNTLAVLEQTFPGVDIGYGTRDNIVPAYRPYIERSAVRVF
jgi:predicted nucleotidyltransferase